MEELAQTVSTKKTPYQAPTLQKREQLDEIVIGGPGGSIVL
jgi:hypothetical protein